LDGGFESFWTTEMTLTIGDLEVGEDLRHWVNDALMVIFFFVVGLEIKRELVTGELNDFRKAMFPVIAAVGGMVGPALIYLAFNAGRSGEPGWGIPMATDIAFVAGVMALLSKRVSPGLKVFLLSLAIVDDVGAILVIALFYSTVIQLEWLMGALLLLLAIVVLRRLRVHWVPAYAILGVLVWLATLESGVHATIAGVALALLTPARPTEPGGLSVAERVQHLLHPWSSFLIVPVFALANAGLALGVETGEKIASHVAAGVIVGLVVGKIVGISAASWVATRMGVARLPDGVTWRHIVGGAALAGIGFTVSLFVTGLAFSDPALISEAKIGILTGSIAAGLLGTAILSARSEGSESSMRR
jgi:NhaA family Na+:H+ antiporter